MDSVKFGKKPPKLTTKTPLLANYIDGGQPIVVPPAVHWAANVPNWGGMWNHKLGTCVEAAFGHTEQMWSSNVPPYRLPTDQSILDFYSAVSGYNQQTGANDNGSSMYDSLVRWRDVGIGVNLHKITGWAYISPQNINIALVKRAIYLFGVVQIGFACPESAILQYQAGQPWTLDTGPNGDYNPANGHCVPIFGYDEEWLYFVTWGVVKKMALNFLPKYVDEAYAVLSPDWFAANSTAPNGFNSKKLLADLKNVGPPI